MSVMPGRAPRHRDQRVSSSTGAWAVRISILLLGILALALSGARPFAGSTVLSAAGAAAQAIVDSDGDGMPDDWELFFGLNPNLNDAAGDPDGDGLTNLQEYQQGGHPFGTQKRYFAEGALGFFETDIGLVNSSTTDVANVVLTYLTESGAKYSQKVKLQPMQRQTVSVNDFLIGLGGGISTIIESNIPIAADRFMEWGANGYGSSLSASLAAPSQTWYFAEGATGIFQLYYLLLNPSPTATAHVSIKYLQEVGPPVTRTYTVEPHSRSTISVNDDLALLFTSAGAVVAADIPIVAERAMYLSSFQHVFEAGASGGGSPLPSTQWLFAEGSPGGLFDEFLLLANPNTTATVATVTYRRADGVSATADYAVPGQSRVTVWVNFETATNPALSAIRNSPISTKITAPQPIVAERTMWWGRGAITWYENATSIGATQTATSWTVAEGAVGGSHHDQTFVLIASNSNAAGQVQVKVLADDGSTATQTLPIPAFGRLTVEVGPTFSLASTHFSVIVDSVGPSPVPIVVEYSRYGGNGPGTWPAGGSTLATPHDTTPADTAPTVTSTTPPNGATGVSTSADLSVTFSEQVNVTPAAFTLECPAGTPITLTNLTASPATTFNLHPTTSLPFNTQCKLVIHASAVTDTDTTDPPDNMASDVTVTFTTGACPTITVSPSSLTDGTVGVAYGPVQFTQTGGNGVITWSMSSGTLPAGMTFSAAGQLSGTPTATGTFTFTVRATDANGCFGERTVTLNITCPTITVNPASLANGTTGTPYGPVNFSQTGSTGTVTFSVSAGTLPAGLGLTGAGVLSGTPTAAGTSSFSVKAQDQFGCSGTRALTLQINCPTITVSPSSLTNATVGVAYTPVQFTQTGGNGTVTFAVSSGTLPAGMTLSASGLLSGTPTATGTFNFTVRATDANGCFGEVAVSLTVACPVITVTNPGTTSFPGGVALSQTFTQTGAATPTFSIGSGTLPTGLTLSTAGVLSGTPTATGSFPITVTVTDAFGCTGTGSSYPLVIRPNAIDDTYTETVLGNVPIDSSVIGFNVLTNDFLGSSALSAFDATSANGGTVVMTMTGPNAGQFTYDPPRGFIGNDTFTYSIFDGTTTSTATVHLTVANMVWFINNNAGACPAAPCDGRLSHPYTTLAQFQTDNANGTGTHPKVAHTIFIYESATSYTGGVVLKANQHLFGQDSLSPNFTNLTGITPPTSATGLPAINPTGATVPMSVAAGQTAVTLASGSQTNIVRGMAITTAGSTANGISGTSFGTVNVSDLSITGSGQAINLTNGAVTALLTSLSSIGTAAHGIAMTNTTGTFEVIGDGASDPANTTRGRTTARQGGGTITLGSGGTISGATTEGVFLSNAAGVTLRNMTIQNNTGDGVYAAAGSSNLTLDNVLISGHAAARGLHGPAVNNLTLQHVDINNNATAAGVETFSHANVDFGTRRNVSPTAGEECAPGSCPNGLTGTATVANSSFSTARDNVWLLWQANTGTLNMTITNSLFSSSTLASTFNVTAWDSANVTINASGSTFQNSKIAAFNYNGNDSSGGGTLTVSNNVFTNNGVDANIFHQGLSKTVDYMFNANTTRQTFVANSSTSLGAVVGGVSNAATQLRGKFINNVVGNAGVTDSGSAVGQGIAVESRGAGTHTVLLTGNTVKQVHQDSGFLASANSGTNTLNITASGNDFESNTGILGFSGIELYSGGSGGSDATTVCANFTGGNVAFIGSTSVWGIGAEVLASASVINLQGYAGAANNAAQLQSFLDTTATTVSPGSVVTIVAGTIKSAPSSCPTPP
jgi:hypothetical protein